MKKSKVYYFTSILLIITTLFGCHNTRVPTLNVVSFLGHNDAIEPHSFSYYFGIRHFMQYYDNSRYSIKHYEKDAKTFNSETMKRTSYNAVIGHLDAFMYDKSFYYEVPVITSSGIIDYSNILSNNVFMPCPNIGEDTRALARNLPPNLENILIIRSEEEIYYDLAKIFNEELENKENRTIILSNDIKNFKILYPLLEVNKHDAIILLVNHIHFSGLIDAFSQFNHLIPVYAPTFILKYYSVPPTYNSEKFNIFYLTYEIEGLKETIETPLNFEEEAWFLALDERAQKIIIYNIPFLIDGVNAMQLLHNAVIYNDKIERRPAEIRANLESIMQSINFKATFKTL